MGCPIDRLPAWQIRALVETHPAQLPRAVAAAVREFLERIGGLENARLAVEMLESLDRRRELP
jgi:hypothetical protein